MIDVTGRTQFVRNVIVSWGMHVFVLAVGFIVPRQISDNLGAEALGVWDLGWITVRYLTTSTLGVGAALTRYVALYKAQEDYVNLSKAATAVVYWQTSIAILILLFSWLGATGLVSWVDIPSSYQSSEVRAVIFLLGVSVAVEMFFTPAGGIITGCHYWDIQHTINAVRDFVLAILMISLITLGFGLVSMAWAVVGTAFLSGLIRVVIAKRLITELKIHPSLWDLKIGIEMLRFGIKSTLTYIPTLMAFQLPALLLSGFAGPAALAVFNRGISLVSHCSILVGKVNKMYAPMASGLLGIEKREEAQAQLIYSGRYSLALILPIALGLICYGDIILFLWMGEGYDNWMMLTILVCGAILPISQDGVVGVMAGLNAHGRIAIASIVLTAISLGIGISVLTVTGWSVIAAACLTAFSWTAGRGFVIPYFLRRYYKVSLLEYLYGAILVPLICNLPLLISLMIGRQFFNNGYWPVMLACWALGAIITAAIYWKWVLPEEMRQSINKRYAAIFTKEKAV